MHFGRRWTVSASDHMDNSLVHMYVPIMTRYTRVSLRSHVIIPRHYSSSIQMSVIPARCFFHVDIILIFIIYHIFLT